MRTAQFIKCLLNKPKDLSLNLSIYTKDKQKIKEFCVKACVCSPSTGEQWDSLAVIQQSQARKLRAVRDQIKIQVDSS